MGREAACTARIGGRTVKGRALLESTEIIFRGQHPLRIPFAEIERLEAADGGLVVTHRGQRVVFALGPEAAKWRERIQNPPSRARKLGLKSGMKVAVLGALDEADRAEIAACVGQRPAAPAGGEDLVFLVVDRKADLAALARLAGRIDPAGAIWVIRRKGKAAVVSEAESMAAGKAAGLVDNKVVSFSETHTAERYVIPVAARKSAPRPATKPAGARRG
jgi:hypothetical protein